ncbi:MAG: CoA transferase, partial [Microbacterium sp.]|uniref:CoA transferase n=1 Tax=Microbacterium sp. TaxID=51671 RepID=UPI00262596F6
GDSDPIPAGAGHRPLGGVRVLDLTRVLAGPTAARTLAEHGAHVLRIASPLYPDVAPMVRDTGHGKRSTVLDLRTTEGAGALRRLIEGADVFSQGYRPGAIARLGFSPEELATIRPGIISLSISAFGVVGPWGDSRGFDSVVQAASGVAEEMGGIFGLERRAREGGSYHIELSLAQTGRYLNDLPRVDAAAAAGRAPELPKARLDELLVERDTPYGMLKYLKPAARLSATPARWELPTVPVDNDRPQW